MVATAVVGMCLAVMYYMFIGGQNESTTQQKYDDVEEDELL